MRPKIYGKSQVPCCPFCGKQATQKSEEGVDVCRDHTKQILPECKCTCKAWLELKVGKFGPYFHCYNCGNINFKKVMAIRKMIMPLRDESVGKVVEKKKTPKEITITTDDHEYFS
jgi:hypothetical protein